MIIKYKAYATIKDGKDGWKRIKESICDTEDEAKKFASDFAEMHKEASTGIHKYYVISRKEWSNEQYTGISINDGKTKTWMINEGDGPVLLFEGIHFEIR